MEHNSAVPPNITVQGGSSDYGHVFHGGPPYNLYDVRPPQFWRPQPQFHGFGPRGYPPPGVAPFRYAPPMFSFPPPAPPCHSNYLDDHKLMFLKRDDEVWLSNWLKSHSFQQPSKVTSDKGVSIFEACENLKQCVKVLEDLKQKQVILQEGLATLPEEDWKALLADIEKKKLVLSGIMNSYFSEKFLAVLQKKLSKRARKRSRQRCQLAKRREELYLTQMRRQSLHKKADAWLADMQLAVERVRKDEELKKEADSVLAEVTRRQSEGRRQVALLEALQKLHHARVQAKEACGSKLSPEEKGNAEHSILVFDRLLSLWSEKMDEYGKEEHGLRVMLQESAAKQSDLEIQKVHCILGEWETCLFGPKGSLTSDEPPDIDTLVSIRYAWDQYLVPDKGLVPMASSIPVGWVLPTTPSSSEWQTLLSRV